MRDRYKGTVPNLFEGETAVLFATGPSLTTEQVEAVWPFVLSGKVRAFGCNDAYRIVPYLDVHYACDPQWWDVHVQKGWILDYVCSSKWTQDKNTAQRYSLSWVLGSGNAGLHTESRDHIHFGGNSGFQLLNVAYHYGIRHFILLGYDMRSNVKTHFFGDHPKGLHRGSGYQTFLQRFDTVQPAIRRMVVNCTPGSALQSFEKRGLHDVLSELE